MPEPSREPGGSDVLATTDRSMLRRKKERGSYDREVINAILDEGLLCHAGFSVEGSTFVVPMAYARIRDTLYLHGATGNRMLRHLADGADVCVTVTLLDALVLARSAFHHSMNFRSVMLFGTASRVDDDDEKLRATTALLEHVASGRSADARPPSAEELRAALMIRIPIADGSAKVRTGGPIDEPEDLGERIWAGQIPLSIAAGAAISDGVLPRGTAEPTYVRSYPDRSARPAVTPSTRARGAGAEPGG
ncbi:MAG TPA: pyridoxamine 5'-phosphate oxidase family protein [Candidatus Saccharimonadales bacterium]|nr:pyridoxamine 5'-phosphate oxidase family protein [Candidatus Saccharimonadales bacterium]